MSSSFRRKVYSLLNLKKTLLLPVHSGLLLVLLTPSLHALPVKAETNNTLTGELIWHVICREYKNGVVKEFKIFENDVLVSHNFNKPNSLVSSKLSKIIIAGDSTSLSIHQFSIFAPYPGLFRMEFWNKSNPELFNSFYMKNYWSEDGAASTSTLKMNCKALKSIKSAGTEVRVYGDLISNNIAN